MQPGRGPYPKCAYRCSGWLGSGKGPTTPERPRTRERRTTRGVFGILQSKVALDMAAAERIAAYRGWIYVCVTAIAAALRFPEPVSKVRYAALGMVR